MDYYYGTHKGKKAKPKAKAKSKAKPAAKVVAIKKPGKAVPKPQPEADVKSVPPVETKKE